MGVCNQIYGSLSLVARTTVKNKFFPVVIVLFFCCCFCINVIPCFLGLSSGKGCFELSLLLQASVVLESRGKSSEEEEEETWS